MGMRCRKIQFSGHPCKGIGIVKISEIYSV